MLNWLFDCLGFRFQFLPTLGAAGMAAYGLVKQLPLPLLIVSALGVLGATLLILNELLRWREKWRKDSGLPASAVRGSWRTSLTGLGLLVLMIAVYSGYKIFFFREPSLHDYFWSDFNKTAEIKVIIPINIQLQKDGTDQGTFPLEMGMYGNWDANSVFVSFYVPASQSAYDLITVIADRHNEYISNNQNYIHIWTAPRGDSHQPFSDEFHFTGMIYIYHENVFKDEQVSALMARFSQNHVSVVFRGAGYLGYRQLQDPH